MEKYSMLMFDFLKKLILISRMKTHAVFYTCVGG